MEASTNCRQNDIVCIAGELLARWDARERARQYEEKAGLGKDCLPCILQDWDPAVDD